jgi:large subunit ribosomal protein L23
MVRAPGLSPYHARFLVPLDFSKYDLRDYLYHAYNVKCFNVRSYVKQMPIRDTTTQPRHWFRPDSKKYMTVEMEQPFVWPALPTDMTPWGIGNKKKEIKSAAEANDIVTPEQRRENAKTLRERVKRLLESQKSVTSGQKSQKRAADKVLTAEETEKEDAALQTGLEEKMSALRFWEQQRSQKMVTSDESSRFAIKV